MPPMRSFLHARTNTAERISAGMLRIKNPGSFVHIYSKRLDFVILEMKQVSTKCFVGKRKKVVVGGRPRACGLLLGGESKQVE